MKILAFWLLLIEFFILDHVNITSAQDEIKTENRTKGKNSNGLNVTKEIDMEHPAMNITFCKGKPDGTYLDEFNCEQFILCAQSKTLSKKCPNGLRYNANEGACDWPRNVKCRDGGGALENTSNEETASNNDDDVYTRKFIGRLKLNDTSVEN